MTAVTSWFQGPRGSVLWHLPQAQGDPRGPGIESCSGFGKSLVIHQKRGVGLVTLPGK